MIKPMLATLAQEPFDDPEWLFEIKWDGYRAIAEKDKKDILLYSRNQLDFSELYWPITQELSAIKEELILDGEIVVVDEEGRGSFQLLQQYNKTGTGNLVYYVFDILFLNGEDLRSLPLSERRKILEKTIQETDRLKISQTILAKGRDFFHAAQQKNLEGIVGKNLKSVYRSGVRSKDWLKIKTHMRQEAVIGGYTEGRGSRKLFGALVLGVYKDKELTYVGHTGGGFNDQKLKDIFKLLEKLKTDKSPFKKTPKTNAPVTWVEPKLVCEVEFSEWTQDGSMRQPIFVGLRIDKDPAEVRKEEPEDKNVAITHADKVFWPKEGFTKGELINYYRQISKYILPYLKDRPESMLRHPHGVEGKSFFQKNITKAPDWVKIFKYKSKSENKTINFLVCQDEPSLIYMINLGVVEVNPWNSRIQHPDKPDYLIIDLDPEDIGFESVVIVAQAVKKVLDRAKIKAYCKTSGATGLHICIPLGAQYTYDQVKDFAELIARLAHGLVPDISSVERSPSKRQKKVYIDYLQNRRGQTLTAPYSVRPRPGMTVSTPLEWSEVNAKLSPTKFTVKTIFKRLESKGDLWMGVLGPGIDLKESLENLTFSS